ncbi:DUF3846 domain-containing protein [Shewanella sp. MM_2022_3]|uniref:DUF3846 domain-containing protein n=1 Tax=Shewanella sp. MM_2022_3 TaxID=2923280 RepID=UPI001F4C3D5B|nr:DUF3846 domain-containing protein [Shewanella sp. MM_2022_3]MCH7421477.1 DUF3846 domain-containing protein [Shewanella sp. MM_2022_3]
MSYAIKFEIKGTPETGYVLFKTHEEIGRNKLASFQQLVGGLIEPVVYIDGAVLLMNENALHDGSIAWRVPLELERIVPEHFKVKGHKVLVGPVILVADDGQEYHGFQTIELADKALSDAAVC